LRLSQSRNQGFSLEFSFSHTLSTNGSRGTEINKVLIQKKQRFCPTRARYWSLVDVLPKCSEFARSAFKYIRNFKPVDVRFHSAVGHLCSQMDRVRPWSSSEKWSMVIYCQFRDHPGQTLLVQEFKKPVLKLKWRQPTRVRHAGPGAPKLY